MTDVHPRSSKPVAIAAFFDIAPAKDGLPGLQTIQKAIRDSRVVKRAPLYLGSYGPNPDVARAAALVGARYAPMFTIQPGKPKPGVAYAPAVFYQERGAAGALSPDELGTLDPALAGPIPISPGVPLPLRDHDAWGLELGRRYRDRIRHARQHGMAVACWQFDEILLEVEVGVPATTQQLEVHGRDESRLP